MKQYTDLVSRILTTGERREDRTGTGTLSVFGGSMVFDLRERFPLVTVKETRYKVAFLEMLWFLRGEQCTDYLHKHGCKLWDEWADKRGHVGPIYGVNWRNWPDYYGNPIDQIDGLIKALQANPTSRRHIVSAWNVADLPDMALPPCHRDFQCYVSNDGELDLTVSQRSWDIALGAPFNIAQYALLTHLLARAANLTPRMLRFNYGDAHIYTDHVEAMTEVITRESLDFPTTRLFISTLNKDIDGYKPDDFHVEGYVYHPFVKLKVSK